MHTSSIDQLIQLRQRSKVRNSDDVEASIREQNVVSCMLYADKCRLIVASPKSSSSAPKPVPKSFQCSGIGQRFQMDDRQRKTQKRHLQEGRQRGERIQYQRQHTTTKLYQTQSTSGHVGWSESTPARNTRTEPNYFPPSLSVTSLLPTSPRPLGESQWC